MSDHVLQLHRSCIMLDGVNGIEEHNMIDIQIINFTFGSRIDVCRDHT